MSETDRESEREWLLSAAEKSFPIMALEHTVKTGCVGREWHRDTGGCHCRRAASLICSKKRKSLQRWHPSALFRSWQIRSSTLCIWASGHAKWTSREIKQSLVPFKRNKCEKLLFLISDYPLKGALPSFLLDLHSESQSLQSSPGTL